MKMLEIFTYVARQKRITFDGRYFYIDLVFYNYLLKYFVLIDLKVGDLTHQDLGQMQMYVHYFEEELLSEIKKEYNMLKQEEELGKEE